MQLQHPRSKASTSSENTTFMPLVLVCDNYFLPGWWTEQVVKSTLDVIAVALQYLASIESANSQTITWISAIFPLFTMCALRFLRPTSTKVLYRLYRGPLHEGDH